VAEEMESKEPEIVNEAEDVEMDETPEADTLDEEAAIAA
jgi:hypothetical protein